MQTPDIIFLYGASSAGKTTLAKALQRQLEAVYLHVPVDAFGNMFPESKLGDPELCSAAAPKLFEGFYRSVAALVGCGNRVIVDTIPHAQGARAFKPLFDGFKVLYVAVKCPVEELERRESARGDRIVGLARRQSSDVEDFLRCDVEVDTHDHSAEACAALIKEFITP